MVKGGSLAENHCRMMVDEDHYRAEEYYRGRSNRMEAGEEAPLVIRILLSVVPLPVPVLTRKSLHTLAPWVSMLTGTM